MKHQNCKYGEKCKFFHPKKLKNNIQNKKPIPRQTYQPETYRVENPTYSHIVRNSLQSNGPFLGQAQNPQQPVTKQENQFQQPFLGQRNQTQVFLDLQNGQKQLMDLFMSLNQKLATLEKYN